MSRWPLTAAVVTVLLAGCGDSSDKAAKKPAAPKPAASADEFVARFEKLTSLKLTQAEDPFGTRLDEPDGDALTYRLSGFSYYWTTDDHERGILMEGRPGPDGTKWDKV